MNLTKFSVDRFYESAEHWDVPDGYAEVIYNYLVYGLQPGSFFNAVLANDMFEAMIRSHPSNQVQLLAHTMSWLNSMGLRGVAWGNYDAINNWLKMDEATRRAYLEKAEVIYTEREEILKVLTEGVSH